MAVSRHYLAPGAKGKGLRHEAPSGNAYGAIRLGPVTAPLLHMLTTADWKAALIAGVVAPPSLDEVGFVHLSTAEQVAVPANHLFTGRTDVQLLVLDPERIGAEIRWEDGDPPHPDGMQFPHAYGPVPTSSVLAVRPYPPRDDGGFDAPVRPGTDTAARAAGFETALLHRAATTEVPVTGGVAVLTGEVPQSHMHNQLLITGDVDARQLAADADEVLGGAGLTHRHVTLGGAHHTRTAAALAAQGWNVERCVVMAAPAGGEPDRRVEPFDVDGLRAHWAAMWRRNIPGIDDTAVRQLADRNLIEARVADLRFLGVRAGGEVVASCILKIDGATAWLDAVNTDPDHGKQGHGDALLATASALAADAGCDLLALSADAEDWPRNWYARRGFAEVGESWTAAR